MDLPACLGLVSALPFQVGTLADLRILCSLAVYVSISVYSEHLQSVCCTCLKMYRFGWEDDIAGSMKCGDMWWTRPVHM